MQTITTIGLDIAKSAFLGQTVHVAYWHQTDQPSREVVLLEMLNGTINMNPVMFRLLFN